MTTCITAFKINIGMLSDDEIDELINEIDVEPGVTEQFLFFGLQKRSTDSDEYELFEQLHDTLSSVYDKMDILKKLSNIFPIKYTVEVKFSDIEAEIAKNTSFTISDESTEFIETIGAEYILNNGYFNQD